MFVRTVVRHWKSIVTGGFLTAILWVFQGVGWFSSPHWLYWTVAVAGLLFASYQAWLDQYRRAEALAMDLKSKGEELARHLDDRNTKRKQELIHVLTLLRAVDSKAKYWHEKTDGRWGMSKPAENLLPQEFAHVLYVAGQVDPSLRSEMEKVESNLRQAESNIREFKNQPPTFQQDPLMRQAYAQLNEAMPLLSRVISELAALEKTLH